MPRKKQPTTPDQWRQQILDQAAAHVEAEARLYETVQSAHDAGCTWTDIARLLNVSPQAVQQRFSKPPRGRLT